MDPQPGYRLSPPGQLGFSSSSPPIGFNSRIQVLPNISAVEDALKCLRFRLDKIHEPVEKRDLLKTHSLEALRPELLDGVNQGAKENKTSVDSSLPEYPSEVLKHATIDDCLERSARVRLADSCVLRLLDYFVRHADHYETWDWEIDADLTSPELAFQTGALQFSEMLPEVISLHTELLKINATNMKTLRRLQDRLTEQVEQAGPFALELSKRYAESMSAVAEAVDIQKCIADFNLTVLADRCLGDREKYFVYDPAKKELTLDIQAYMKSVISDDLEGEPAARELDRRVAVLYWDGGAEAAKHTHKSTAGKRLLPPSEVAKQLAAPNSPILKMSTRTSRGESKAEKADIEEIIDESAAVGAPDCPRLSPPKRFAKIEIFAADTTQSPHDSTAQGRQLSVPKLKLVQVEGPTPQRSTDTDGLRPRTESKTIRRTKHNPLAQPSVKPSSSSRYVTPTRLEVRVTPVVQQHVHEMAGDRALGLSTTPEKK